jgi:hypothetical protein
MRIPRRAFVSQKAPLPEGNARLPPAALILTRLGNGSLSPCLVRIALGVIEAEATLKMRIFPPRNGENLGEEATGLVSKVEKSPRFKIHPRSEPIKAAQYLVGIHKVGK